MTETDRNVKPANTRMITNIFVWTSITLALILCLFYFMKIISEKSPDNANTIYIVVGGIGFMLFLIYIRLFTNTRTKKIQYGAMTSMSLISIVLSLMAYNNVLFSSTSA